jgi:hypothetical protein
MTPEQERWAEALAIDRHYGGDAPRHVAGRIGALTLEGDLAGVARWRQIAARLDQMMRGALLQPKDMSDRDLVAAYERTTGQRGDANAGST